MASLRCRFFPLVGLVVDHTPLTAVAYDSPGMRVTSNGVARAELLSGIEGVSSWPVHRILLREG